MTTLDLRKQVLDPREDKQHYLLNMVGENLKLGNVTQNHLYEQLNMYTSKFL